MRVRFLPILLLAFAVPSAWAQSALTPGGDKPVAIEADEQLEWLRADHSFRASGNVTITQGDTRIQGDKAHADYDPDQGPSALTNMVVTGNVIITSGLNTIRANEATYDTRSEVLNLRGKTVTLTAPSGTITAADGMDYFAKERRAVSTGRAEVSQKNENLKADRITAWLNEKNELTRATASGNVVITQSAKDGQNVATAQRGDYDATKQLAVLTGDVRLTQGKNHMQGDKATINLATGYSTLQNTAASGGRVRAIFTPNKNADASPANNAIAMPSVMPKKTFEQPYAVGNTTEAAPDPRGHDMIDDQSNFY